LNALEGIKESFIPYGFDSSWIQTGVRIKKILLDHFINEDVKYAEFINISPKAKLYPAALLNEQI
jgi:hypothetical protein